jgi:hypothetical protein
MWPRRRPHSPASPGRTAPPLSPARSVALAIPAVAAVSVLLAVVSPRRHPSASIARIGMLGATLLALLAPAIHLLRLRRRRAVAPARKSGGPEVVNLVEVVSRAWGFTGLIPRAVLEVNRFGNLLVQAEDGRIWRIVPQDLSCQIVAGSAAALVELRASARFQRDWRMEQVVALAVSALGNPAPGRCFCLKRPAPLGGDYQADNLATLPLPELIDLCGHLADQIDDLPDGAAGEIRIVD